MTPKHTVLEQLVIAAKALLETRDDSLGSNEEWNALAKAVAAVEPTLVDDARTYEGFLEVWTDACQAAAKAALDQEGVGYTDRWGAGRTAFDVPRITAGQYGRVIESLMEAGEAGVDWNFTLD